MSGRRENICRAGSGKYAFFLPPTKTDSVFVATNRMRRGRIEFFLERPYLDNATILLNMLLADASHPAGSNVFVGSDLSFCSPLSWRKGGVTHYLKSKPRGSSSYVLSVFSFQPEGSVPFLLAGHFSFTRGTLFSPAVPWAALCLCVMFWVLFPCCSFTNRLPAQDWAVGVISISLLADFPPPPRSSSASINPVFGPSVPVSLHTGSSRSIAKLISLPQK